MCDEIRIETVIKNMSREIAELEKKNKILENENAGLKKVIEVEKKNMAVNNQLMKIINSPEGGIYRYKNKYILSEKIYKNVMTRFLESEIMPEIKNVMFEKNSVKVIWDDETETVVKLIGVNDKEKLLLMAIVKKLYSENDDWYYDELKIWCKTGTDNLQIPDNKQKGSE